MATTDKLALTIMEASQAQKHTTFNDALTALDAIIMLSVKGLFANVPPGSPVGGDRYITGGTPTGAWAGQTYKLVVWQDGIWRFFAPKIGWICFVENDGVYVLDQAFAWVKLASLGSPMDNIPRLGINGTSDATNKLLVQTAAMLFNNIGAGIQAKFNKNAAGDTASILFQTAFTGRAEIGTTGDNDFHFKMFDGSTWREALLLLQNGVVKKPSTPRFHAYGATPPAVLTAAVFAYITYNIGTGYSTSTGRFTAPVAGDYRFSFGCISNATTSFLQYYVYKNGANFGTRLFYSDAAPSAVFRTVGSNFGMTLAAGDYIDIRSDNVSAFLNTNELTTFFEGELVG